MRSKKVLVLLVLVGVVTVWLIATRNGSDEQIADDLLRRQQAEEATVSADSQTNLFAPDMFQLTSRLVVEKDETRDVWSILAKGDRSTVRLPFVPTNEGEIRDATSNTSQAGKDSSRETPDSSKSTDPTRTPALSGYLGAQACAECHKEKHNGFIHTAHHLTSGEMGRGKVYGDFSGEKNSLATKDPELSFEMTREGDRYIQQIDFVDWSLKVPMSIVTGSAKSGQTFLYWYEDALFQAHVSYLTALDEWIPSPGYPDTIAEYTRAIRPGCLECHMTYIEDTRPPNHYDASTAIWGISCERCHGPGAPHVAYHRQHPSDRIAKHIANPSDLSRQSQLDLCGQCHSGMFKLLQDAFSYRPGDDLTKFHKLDDPNPSGVGGIHTSNQLTRLSMSACFQRSEMTCTTCHNPHENQHGQTAVFTKVCLDCHQPDHCGMSTKLGDRLSENCVECHMPRGDNENMTLQVAGGTFTVKMIDHYIRVDAAATEAYLKE